MKLCSKCQQPGVFSPDRRHKDGLQSQCNTCKKLYWQEMYYSNPRLHSLKTIEWQRNNPSKYGQKSRRWRQANKGLCNFYTARRHAAKLQRTPKWLTKAQHIEIQQFYVESAELPWLSEGGLTVDHIVPLRGESVSGLHVPWNLQIISGPANFSKGNKF